MRSAALSILGFIASCMLVGCTGGGTTGTPPGTGGLDATADAAADSQGAVEGGGFDALADAEGGSPNAADCGALVWATPSCASCTSEFCCSFEQLCAAIPSCVPLSACWTACGADAGCTSSCGAQYTAAITNYNAILNCQDHSCSTVCPP
jgi:hypothetical protein